MIAVRLLGVGVIAYLIGSIPTAYLVGRLVKGLDIRSYGSGNVGATNVMRVLGTGPGLITLGIDALKGFVVVRWIVAALCAHSAHFPLWQIFGVIMVVVGHNWMIFLGFKGGKGVATTAGAFLAMSPPATLSAIAVWAAAVACTRYVSLGSILAGIALPLFMFLFHQPLPYVWFALFLTVALIYKHRGNIQRLLAGTERKIGEREKI
ncbi:MAG: glycerol-3-phosphate 1-O-acyltransferase PlsY [Candidatus Aureabacteria bacterium]|nr:glycerol-3-phosphate 1-O-acyltransferase PlsY [Candidatus Auribacterota bacterium]